MANGISNWQRCPSKDLKNKEVWEKKKEGHILREGEGIVLAGAGFDERRGGWPPCCRGGRCVAGRGVLNA